jgi:xylan 1,4-beta-xylosidase
MDYRSSVPSALALLLIVIPAAHASHVRTVRVGFAKPIATLSMVGFVHGMDQRNPSDEMIKPLAPQLWRGKLNYVPYDRAQEIGGRYTYVLSDRWGYPGDGAKPPYENFGAWERFVRQTARASRRGRVLWDIWNEPNEPHFWRGTPEQLYETYRIAENVLRQELGPDVVVGGPSTLGWRSDWITGLLEYCLTHGCQVNVLSWHELSSGAIPAIEGRVEYARENLAESSRYRPLRIEELHVNEAIIAADQYRPGSVLGVMHYLEAGGADAAARTCWHDMSGGDNCYNDTLAGLLQPGSFEPRSVWWATKAYADGAGSRVLTRFSDPHVVGLASSRSDEPRSAQLLIAHMRGHSRGKVDVKVTFRKLRSLGFLRGARSLRVEIERFPDTGELPLSKPRGRRPAVVPIEDGEATLTLHDVRMHEAYRLRLSAP